MPDQNSPAMPNSAAKAITKRTLLSMIPSELCRACYRTLPASVVIPCPVSFSPETALESASEPGVWGVSIDALLAECPRKSLPRAMTTIRGIRGPASKPR